MPKIYCDVLKINGSPLDGENPLPLFRNRPYDTAVKFDPSLPQELRTHFGENTARRVLPYNNQDRYTRNKRPMDLKLIVLENDKLKASFTTELGGRLWSLVQKQTGRELLSSNTVYQPANLAIRNAWFSGGIEWNIGYLGHACHTCSSVFAAKVENDGETFLRLYEFERMTRVFWQIDFHLPEGSNVLYSHVKIFNPNNADTHTYWWTNIAVPETGGVRVFASADDAIYLKPGGPGQKTSYGLAAMPTLSSQTGNDFSYPSAFDFSNEYFFQCQESGTYWEAAAYENGDVFFDMSTHPLRYRKMFCWGQHAGGRHWQEFLSEPGTAYLEIQAGLAPTQLHAFTIPGGAIEWTQVFGGMSIDKDVTHQPDWKAARNSVESAARQIISEEELLRQHDAFAKLTTTPPSAVLHSGSGWGALETMRMASVGEKLPEGLVLSFDTIGAEQAPWLKLMQNGILPDADASVMPSAWMTQREWQSLLEDSLGQKGGRTWLSLLHAGIMAYEVGDEDKAVACWEESVAIEPSAVACRNLAAAAARRGDEQGAAAWMEKALMLPGATDDWALAEEYLEILNHAGRFSDVWAAYEKLPEGTKEAERVQLTVAKAAMELGNSEFVMGLFSRDYASIRENDTILSDLWFKIQAQRIAAERGVPVDDALMAEAMLRFPPPSNIDFRPVGK